MNRLRIADPRSPKARDTLGRYELVRELAFGRFYSVYLACEPGEGRSVVIKRLRDAFPEPHARARMLREARVGMSLRVPQLVRVLGLHDEPELFVVMEYVDGAPLSELLARARGTDVLRCVVPVLLDALQALSSLHGWKDEAGAPGYLVHQAPSARHLRVGLDGVTRLVDLSNLYGRLLGTLPSAQFTLMDSELAPEQAARAALDPRCDLYILGGVLRHALAQARRTDVSALVEVCERATALRPSDRYWSADEMAHALHFAAAEADLLAPREQIARWVRLSRASLIPATATSPRVRPSLPAPAPELAKLLPALRGPGLTTTAIEVARPVARPRTTQAMFEAPAGTVEVTLQAPQPEAGLLIAEPSARGARRPRLPLAVAGLALALSTGWAVHGALERAAPIVATALPAPLPVVAPAQPEPPPAHVEPAPAAPIEPPASPRVVPRRVRDAQPRAAVKAPALPSREPPNARAKAAEEELVLHEPEVLFYDEDDPTAEPRIGVPINPF